MSLSCYRKRGYQSERVAKSVLYRLRAQGIKGLAAVLCARCGSWHVQQTEQEARALRAD